MGICAGKVVEDEPFCPFFVVTMIWEFQQSEVSRLICLHLEFLKNNSMIQPMTQQWSS